jgi:hypothetical protein
VKPLDERVGEGFDILGYVEGSECYYPITSHTQGPLVCPCAGFKWRRNCSHIRRFKEGDYHVTVQFKVTFRKGSEDSDVVAEVLGEPRLDPAHLTVEDVAYSILKTEAFLEKLTGLWVKIEQVL